MSTQNSSCASWCAMNGRSAGLFIMRLAVGFVFIWQGAHKLFGGMDMVTGMVSGLGFPAPAFFAWVLALVEFLGGIAIVLGSGICLMSALLTVAMLVAFFGAHDASFAKGGMAPFLLIGSTLGFAFTGAGKWNLCRLMGMKNHAWACGCGCNGASECACAGKDSKMQGGCCKNGEGCGQKN